MLLQSARTNLIFDFFLNLAHNFVVVEYFRRGLQRHIARQTSKLSELISEVFQCMLDPDRAVPVGKLLCILWMPSLSHQSPQLVHDRKESVSHAQLACVLDKLRTFILGKRLCPRQDD